MNFAIKQSLKIFITSILILMIAIIFFYKLNYNSFLNYELEESKIFAEKISKDIDQHLIEKIKKTKIITAAPVITNALSKSNKHYQSLSKKKRDEEILQKNNKWKTIEDQNNSFILDYTNNEVSKYLKILQHNAKGEYGEIFLTNKYGALVASTAKLTTFAHGHKYWWQGAYNDGNGAVFLDDRGYDDSVDGYVLGVVVPIKKDNEIIGILKANLNILGSINTIIVNHQVKNHEKLKLIRSGGLIVFEEGNEPLSKMISNDLQKKIQAKPNESFVFETDGDKFIVGLAEIKISSEMEGYNFGGDFESIDHKKGNSGESWLILDLNPFSNIVKQTTGIVSILWIIGILLTVVLAITSFIIGKRIAKPLKELIKKTEQISKGDFDAKISLNRTDEIGLLASSFNQMSNYLKESTTSIENLNSVNQQLVSKTKKLKESETKFQTWIQNSPVCTKVVDLDFNLQFMSESGIRELKIDDITKFYGKPYPLEFYPDSYKIPMTNNLKKAKETGEIIIQEASLLDIEGNIIWYHSTIVPVNDEKGKLDYILVVSINTTKRKQAEQALRESENRFKHISMSMADWIWEVNEKGEYLYVSGKFKQILGYELDEIIGKTPFDLMPEDEAIKIGKIFKKIAVKKNPIINLENWNLTKNGDLICLLTNGVPIINKEGKFTGYRGVDKDITKRKQAEEKIKEKSKELEKHYQESEEQRIATLSVLSDLNETTKNLKLEITERKKAEQIQKVLYDISNAVITTDSLDKLISLIQKELGTIINTTNFYIALYDTNTNMLSFPFYADEKDKFTSISAGKTLTKYVIETKKPLLANIDFKKRFVKEGKLEHKGSLSKIWLGVPLKIEGKVVGTIAVQSYTDEFAYDESDMEMLEFVSDQISVSIERKKAEEGLKSALEKAQESDRLKSAFLTNMSHEIRTPMNGILGFTELLKEQQLTGEEQNNYIKVIEKSGDRMLNTINDIIDISKIEAGQVKVVKSKVSVNKILKEQYEFFNSEVQSKGLELIYKPAFSDKEAIITTDKHKLEGILTNLIKNAIKFTKHGNICFGCSLKKESNFEELEFYVKDTGIGIPSDRIHAVFNRFEQADIEDTQVFEGSGLGLAISKSYVEMLGGNISVTSKEGTGSTFIFTIPYIKQSTKETDTEGSVNKNQQASFDNLSVIVAEDDEASRLLFNAILKNKFHKIIYTKTGKETVDKFRENPETNIILMDIKMLDMSGYKATCEIRKFNQDVVIIAQTAYGLSGDREKAIEAGCNDYIAKPINKNDLYKMIERNLG